MRAAESEGLVLERSGHASGYKGVAIDDRGRTTKPFRAMYKMKHVGSFTTAEEAALAYARARAVPESEQVRTAVAVRQTTHQVAAAALRAAESEGLVLKRSSSASGYKGVVIEAAGKPFRAKLKENHLGSFSTVEEAALAYARAESEAEPGLVREAVAAAEAARQAKHQAAAAALRAAESEGLVLERMGPSRPSRSGYKGVTQDNRDRQLTKPFRAKFKEKQLGSFSTAQEAALAYARAKSEAELELIRANMPQHSVQNAKRPMQNQHRGIQVTAPIDSEDAEGGRSLPFPDSFSPLYRRATPSAWSAHKTPRLARDSPRLMPKSLRVQ